MKPGHCLTGFQLVSCFKVGRYLINKRRIRETRNGEIPFSRFETKSMNRSCSLLDHFSARSVDFHVLLSDLTLRCLFIRQVNPLISTNELIVRLPLDLTESRVDCRYYKGRVIRYTKWNTSHEVRRMFLFPAFGLSSRFC